MTGVEASRTVNTVSGGVQFGPVLQGRDIQVAFHLPGAAPVALAQLPPRTAGFSGRNDELAVLTRLLDPAGSADAVVVSAVSGLAGVGKTTLAVQAGHAVRQHGWYPGGVLFIDLHGYDGQSVPPGQALDVLLRALGVPAESIPPAEEERAGLYRSVLAQVPEPVLVIADNASSEAQVRRLLPGTGPHKVLVTSRHTLAGLGARLVDLTVLDDTDAIDLLDAALRVARPADNRITGDHLAATRLVRACGGLPLALQITASILKADPALSADDLADELSVEQERLERLAYDDGSGTAAPSVAVAFGLSYRKLAEVPARVFRLLPINPGPDVSTAGAAVLADMKVAQVRRVLADLARAHLVEAVPVLAGRWRMHDLLRLYAQRLSDDHADADGREQACDRLLDYYLRMSEAADDHFRALPGMAVPAEFTDRDHALAWLDAEQPALTAVVTLAASVGRDQVAMRLPTHLSAYLEWRRRFDDRLITADVSLAAARRLGDRTNEAAALGNLGDALRQVGRFEEAITACQDAAIFFRQTGDRHREGGVLNNLGITLREAGRFKEAITVCLDAAAICQQSEDWHGTSCALNNLGTAFIQADRLDDAITAFQMELALCRQTRDRLGQGAALGNLARVLQEVGRFEEAITAAEDAAALGQQVGDRYGQSIALGHLGLALQGARQFEEAITAYRDAAAIHHETGDQHREGVALNCLSLVLQEAQRFEEAITAAQDAAAVFRETSDRPQEGLALTSLSNALQRAQRFDEAITAAQDAAAICQQARHRLGQGRALTILANALRATQRFEEAITAYQDAAAIYHETGDRDSEAEAQNNLGVALHEAQRFDEAITAAQNAAAIQRENGDLHREAIAQCNLGVALREAGRLGEAITVFRDTAASFRDAGERHGEGRALGNLGLAFQEAQQLTDAISAFEDAAAIFRETGDPDSELVIMASLATARAARHA